MFYCGSGVTAAHDVPAFCIPGEGAPRIYPGSMERIREGPWPRSGDFPACAVTGFRTRGVEKSRRRTESLAASGGRLAYLDWLRFFVVLSLAPFHAALSFTCAGVVYVYDTPIRDFLLAGTMRYDMGPAAFRLFTIFMDNWFMHLLFLVSGVAASLSLRKRSALEFLGERANRLLLPLLLGTLFVISIQSWLRALSFGKFSGSFFSFYPLFFNGISTSPAGRGNFDYGHLWFLLYLWVFCLIALPLLTAMKRKGASKVRSGIVFFARGSLILVPCVWIALLEAVFRPGWPGFQNLVNDWANFTVYFSFFLFGYFAGSFPELLGACRTVSAAEAPTERPRRGIFRPVGLVASQEVAGLPRRPIG